MTAPLPPSSRVTRGVAAIRFKRQPTWTLPVNVRNFTRGSVTRLSASDVRHGTTLTAGGGAPASSRLLPSERAESGVFDAGRITHGLPDANAGASLGATSSNGAVNGLIPSTVPTVKP